MSPIERVMVELFRSKDLARMYFSLPRANENQNIMVPELSRYRITSANFPERTRIANDCLQSTRHLNGSLNCIRRHRQRYRKPQHTGLGLRFQTSTQSHSPSAVRNSGLGPSKQVAESTLPILHLGGGSYPETDLNIPPSGNIYIYMYLEPQVVRIPDVATRKTVLYRLFWDKRKNGYLGRL